MARESRYYKLVKGRPVPCGPEGLVPLFTDSTNRILEQTQFEEHLLVTTTFTGEDYGYGESGDPILWQSLITGSALEEDLTRRYTSMGAAKTGHFEIVEELMERGFIRAE